MVGSFVRGPWKLLFPVWTTKGAMFERVKKVFRRRERVQGLWRTAELQDSGRTVAFGDKEKGVLVLYKGMRLTGRGRWIGEGGQEGKRGGGGGCVVVRAKRVKERM